MADRSVRIVLKNSDIVNRPFSGATVKAGEAIVNTADGIMMFSGVTTSTNEWTPAGTGGNASFFEVGSNLYDLSLRNRIIKYEGITGAGLDGKFLSGTTNGFTLADISSIQGVDSYVTGGTYNPSTDTITLTLNEGKPNVNVTGITDNFTTGSTLIGSIAYFDRNDTLSAYTLDLSTFVSTADTFVNGYSYNSSNNTFTINRNDATNFTATITEVSGLTVNGTLSATTLDGATILSGGTNLLDIINNLDDDIYVTGNTLTPSNNNTPTQSAQLEYNVTPAGGPYFITTENAYVTGGTLSNGIIALEYNDSTITGNTIDISSLDVNDTFVTGFTYDNSNNLTVSLNDNSSYTINVSTVTGMTNTGNLDLQGELSNSTGNVVINDNLDITGTTTSWGDILPGQHLTYDLGAAGQRWDELWVRKIQIGTTTTVIEDGIITVSGGTTDLQVNPNGDLVVDGDIIPPVGSDLVYNIGVAGRRWNNFSVGSITATGMTVSGLDPNAVVFTDGSGVLSTEASFGYVAGTDTMTVGNVNVQNPSGTTATFGQGGVVIGSGGVGDLTIQGDLTVLGDTTTVSTSELFVEDPTITINYSTGTTNATSLGSGIQVQDGDGAGNDTWLKIAELNTFDSVEYPATTGPTNRAWYTNLNDIIIRQATDTTSPTGGNIGVRVLAEQDCLDGGSY